MFPRTLNQCFNLKRHLFCSNQPIFAVRLPIDFFYFEDFRWPFFGKIIGQNSCFASAFVGSFETTEKLVFTVKQHFLSE